MKQHSTNYYKTLITVAEDTRAVAGVIPAKKSKTPTIGYMQFEMITTSPFTYTSDELTFNIHVIRAGIPASEISNERQRFFSKGQPCLRTSALAKSYGWGIYANQEGKINLIDMASEEYRTLLKDVNVTKVSAMRSKKEKS